MDEETHRQRDSDPSAADSGPLAFIVDDDAATLALLCDVVEDSGFVPRGFARLAEAEAELRRAHPALVVLDDNLPDGSGGDLARDLREDASMRDVVVLVCTAAHPMRQAEIGAWAPVVSKPFDIADLEFFLQAAGRQQGRDVGHSAAG